MEHSAQAKDFFEMFLTVRNEISDENGYHLPNALMLAYDRYTSWRSGLPDFDGQYLVLIHQKQECGNVWKYQKVIECFMNRWVVEDETKDIVGWKYLSNNEVVV